MRSKANIKGHPIHPMLVVMPLGILSASFLFDLLALIIQNPAFASVAFYLQPVGISFGLLAAIPGVIDFTVTVPPNSSAKKRGWKHALTNVLALLLFAACWWYRFSNQNASSLIITALNAAGFACLAIAGWLGGTLAYRNQIGVDHRYANAGKWKEQKLKGGGRIRVAEADELQFNQMKLIRLEGKRIVLARTEDGWFAFDDRCTHRGGSLAGGNLFCNTVSCPWHGSHFDIKTGGVKAGPAAEKLKTYRVAEEANGIYLLLP